MLHENLNDFSNKGIDNAGNSENVISVNENTHLSKIEIDLLAHQGTSSQNLHSHNSIEHIE